MKTMKKRFMAMFMIVIMGIISPLAVTQVSAATEYDWLLEEKGTLDGVTQTTASHSFYNPKQQQVQIDILAVKTPDITMKIENIETQQVIRKEITSSSWKYDYEYMVYDVYTILNLAAGNYVITLESEDEFDYIIAAGVEKETLNISDTSLTITAGQKKTLKVTNASGDVKWSSNKTSVATVSSKGVVTAKKAGTATITASSNGLKVTCKVAVKKNVYTNTKATVKNISYGVGGSVHKAYYKSGKIVCQLNIVNNTMYKVKKLQKIQIIAKTSAGKVIAKQSFNKSGVSIASHKAKGLTLTIDKKHVKNKKADLRNARFSIEGRYTYSY